MITINEKQVEELDQFLDKIPHAYAKGFILLIQKFNKENQEIHSKVEQTEEITEVATEQV